ncbi:MAG: outer membrane beta-barrel protein [Deltaproteobacteria bacterium]|nr:outer membrane beta-barrel protein [Deltaproteobacteria bacterium]
MRKRMICTLAATLIITTTTAYAAVKEGGYSVSPILGGHIYDNNQQFNANLVVGARAGYNITKAIGVEALYDYVMPTASKFWSLSDISMHRFGAQALYHFTPDNQLVPYLAAGVAGVKFNGSGVNPKIHSSIDYGAGAKYFVTDNIAVRADIRHILYGYNGATYNNVAFTLGAYFQFGGVTPAAIAVTIVNNSLPGTIAAACTPAPEPVSCAPMPESALCPPVPESVKMIFSPVTREDCEVLWAATTAKDPSVTVARRACEIPPAISVLYGSDRVVFQVDYYSELDRVGEFLKEFPNSKVTIVGHADNTGSKAENIQFSLVRAAVLRSHILYKFKIDRSRISIKGYGESRPVASNQTDAGKAKNRRIEVIFSCE